MKHLLSLVVVMGLLMSCATSEIIRTDEGRKLLLDSPEIQAVISEAVGPDRIKKWCAVDPLIRVVVRLEFADQGVHIPIISDPLICEEE